MDRSTEQHEGTGICTKTHARKLEEVEERQGDQEVMKETWETGNCGRVEGWRVDSDWAKKPERKSASGAPQPHNRPVEEEPIQYRSFEEIVELPIAEISPNHPSHIQQLSVNCTIFNCFCCKVLLISRTCCALCVAE